MVRRQTSPAVLAAKADKAANYAARVAYATCMRNPGVSNMPDRHSNGDFLYNTGRLNGVQVNSRSPQFVKADKACSHFLPNGGEMAPAQQARALAQALRFVACPRKYGIPNMADPVTSGGGISLISPRGYGPDSAVSPRARDSCRAFALGSV